MVDDKSQIPFFNLMVAFDYIVLAGHAKQILLYEKRQCCMLYDFLWKKVVSLMNLKPIIGLF